MTTDPCLKEMVQLFVKTMDCLHVVQEDIQDIIAVLEDGRNEIALRLLKRLEKNIEGFLHTPAIEGSLS